MKRYLFILLSVVFVCPSDLSAHNDDHAVSRNIEFIANEGQWDGLFVYKAITGGTYIFLEKKGFTYVTGASDNQNKKIAAKHGSQHNAPAILNFHAYKVHFEGAQDALITGSKKQPHYYNYFLGNNPDRWKSGIHPFQVVDYKNIYRNIDLRVASEDGNIKYDFIIHPGADAAQIRLRFEGTEGISVRGGALHINTSVGHVEERKPYAYQLINGKKIEIRCVYRVKGNEVTYVFPQGYDRTELLVIDPVVEFSTFTGAGSDNWGNSATYDDQGNFYAGGTVEGPLYPTTPGAFQVTYRGGGPPGTPGTGGGNIGFPCDVVITKFTSDGSALLYSTFLGGSQNEQPHSMIVDREGNLVIAGRTYSNNFPVSSSAYDMSHNGNCDIFIAKLNPAGTSLLASTYFGGSGDDGVNVSPTWPNMTSIKYSYADDGRTEVIVDKQNNIYVAAPTQSADFPLAQATQTTLSGPQDAVVIKLNSTLDNLIWSTYLGGGDYDAAYVLALDTSEQHIYVAGGTASNNFPGVTGGFWPAFQGGMSDGFVVKFQNNGTYPKMRSTFIGMNDYDQCFGIQVDLEDNVYVTGNTLGGSFPVAPGVYSNPGSSQFVMKLNPDLNTNIYSTVFGSGNSSEIDITPVAFLVDTCHNVYISGWGGGPYARPGSNTFGLPVTVAPDPNPAFQPTTDGQDFYFIVLSKDAAGLLYGSYFGGTGVFEHVDGGTSRFDKNGVIYQAICGGCGGTSAVPTTQGAYSRTNGSGNCNLLAVKIAFNLGSVNAVANAAPHTRGCLPYTVDFINNSTNATTFRWDFGDGSPVDTNRAPSHTFSQQGTFNVRLIAFNPNGCNQLEDTIYLQIRVDTNRVTADFEYAIVDSCDPYRASFVNTTQFTYKTADHFTQFDWDFGDGTSYTGETPPVHSYPGPGSYTVTLVVNDTTACNNPDTAIRTIEFINLTVKANMDLPDSICIAYDSVFRDLSQNATSILWDFGDGTTSSDPNPRHRFPDSGLYTVTLAAENPASCNGIDSIQKTIWVKPMPVAMFDHAPQTPQTNVPINFTNRSQNAVRYHWDLGDGTESREEHTSHLYKRTGRYKVCLTAYTPENCFDVFCREVEADIRPLIDVPSAFSPNGDGNNDILYVRGAAVETMVFRVYNRWGEQVFESTDMNIGWDGTYKSKEQEMEVYAYTLYATFYDGSTATKQGNVTLLR